MKIEMNGLNTGWFGLNICLRPEEINQLLENLIELREQSLGHFHIRSSWPEDQGDGIADIEFSIIGDGETENATID